MRDEDKTAAQLIQELRELRCRIQRVETFEAEFKRTERKSEERRLYLERVFACAPDAIATLDERGNISEWNVGAEKLFGYLAQEAIGQNIDELIHGDADLTQETLSGETIASREVIRYRQDGTPVDVIVACGPIVIDDELVGAVAVYTDITERKRLETQLRQAQRMETVGRLAGGIAHDFNNLLTAIQGYTELVLDSLEDEPTTTASEKAMRADLEEITRVAERAETLVRQLLTFSRKQTPKRQVVNLHTVIDDIGRMLERLIGEDIELTTRLGAGSDRIEADRGQVEQVIVNLAINARDAMPQGGKLHIETANVGLDETYIPGYLDVQPGPYVKLTMCDTGIGISREVREHLFEPFFTTKEMRGTGLGLTTVYGIIRQMDGDIQVHTTPGRGTTFEVYLPQTVGAAVPLRIGQTKGHLPRGSETVLLVEDEDMVRDLAQRVLTRQGYTVLGTADSQQALTLCGSRSEPIHLLVTDVVLPGIGGPELAGRLAASRPEMRVLYISGYVDGAMSESYTGASEIPFLQKPFTPSSLSSKVREVLDRPPVGG